MISFIIPVFRSAETLPELHRRLVATFENHATTFEILFIEDGGRDQSWDLIRQLATVDKRVHGFQLSRNYGQHNALLCGIREAKGNIIVTLDDDLQHPPEAIPILLEKLTADFDVVYGTPEQERHGLLRNLASQMTKIVIEKAMGTTNARQVSALRAFRTELREGFANYRNPTVNIDVLLTWSTTRFTAVQVAHGVRQSGKSQYTPHKLVRHALNMMTGFSTRPLRLASVIGFLLASFGFFVLLYVLATWFFIQGSVIPGFAFLASLITIFSGAQLLALGIMGEYLSRMYLRTMEKPIFVIRAHTNRNKPL